MYHTVVSVKNTRLADVPRGPTKASHVSASFQARRTDRDNRVVRDRRISSLVFSKLISASLVLYIDFLSRYRPPEQTVLAYPNRFDDDRSQDVDSLSNLIEGTKFESFLKGILK